MNINWDSQALEVLGITGTIFFIAGCIMYFFPPKKINDWYGYRTRQSKETQEKWDFAQRYSSLLMMKCAIFMILAGILCSLFIRDKSIDIILSTPILLLTAGFLFFKTERTLTKKFKQTQN